MDRSLLRRHLALAKEHVALGRKLVERQRQIVAELERDGHPLRTATKILATFETMQKMHEEHCEMVLAEIADSERQQAAKSMRPMSKFDPTHRCWVHEQLNDNVFAWDPNREWVRWACHHASGVITWDGLLFDGWWPADERPACVVEEGLWSS